MRKKLLITILSCMLILSLVGCVPIEVVEKDTTTDSLQNDELGVPSLTQELEVKDEDVTLKVTYDTGNYNLDKWHVTDSKSVGMSVKTVDLPDGYEVYIDHVHADISLASTYAQINGIKQDSMDDTYHGYNQDGFYIDNNSEYYNVFQIEGYTDQFYTSWGYAFGNYGSISSSYEKLTENNLIDLDTYAERLSVVYDISIKKPGSDKMITKSVSSEVLIPVSQKKNKTVDEIDTDD